MLPQSRLVFDDVNVIDVEHGSVLPHQRVVIVGNRIQTVGRADAVSIPPQAQRIDARGKYLIPGLWDMHTHSARSTEFFYPLFIAYGVTGIRDAGSPVPLDTLRRWRQEIVAGTRIGPPRQVLSGPSLGNGEPADVDCARSRLQKEDRLQTCVTDEHDARHVVDSLKAAGADMIKPRELTTKALYLAIADEARRQHLPFGGHITSGEVHTGLTYREASDRGARIIDHVPSGDNVGDFNCWGPTATAAACGPIAERFRKNGTWWVPTLVNSFTEKKGVRGQPVYAQFKQFVSQYWKETSRDPQTLRYTLIDTTARTPGPGYGVVAQQAGLPILAGTDVGGSYRNGTWPYSKHFTMLGPKFPGASLHTELALYVAEGLSPLTALQSATLNPAKCLHATDSLGTIAPGKLADVVVLDANPLESITNTTRIRAVVANGRYFDRAALDRLLRDVRTKAQKPR